MATPDSPPTLTMKLHVDTKTRRVVLAETTKAAVDYLHSLLESHHQASLDDATVSAGCARNLHNSVEELAAEAASAPLRPPPKKRRRVTPSPVVVQEKHFFKCSFKHGAACGGYVTEKCGFACPSCGRPMATAVPDGEPGAGCSAATAGEVAPGPPPVRCLLMDDLSVTPMDWFGDTMSAMFLGSIAVQKRTVQLGYNEGLAILEASLRSHTALSDAFVREKAPILRGELGADTTDEDEEEEDDEEEEEEDVEEVLLEEDDDDDEAEENEDEATAPAEDDDDEDEEDHLL